MENDGITKKKTETKGKKYKKIIKSTYLTSESL